MSGGPPDLRVSTPGRICLFGEHQDYLHLPVIAAAISLRIAVEGRRRADRHVQIDLPDIGGRESFDLENSGSYVGARDYFRSAVTVLQRHGFSFSSGIDGSVRGEIPINAGTSSSSALVVCWISLLARLSDQRVQLSPKDCAKYSHEAEVVEFGEPGGMMDQYTTAVGGILFIEFQPELRVDPIDAPLGQFVLGDSGESKNTTSVLAGVKERVHEIVRMLSSRRAGFSLRDATPDSIRSMDAELTTGQLELLKGTIRNHCITHEALALLNNRPFDHARLGALLTEHHAILRDVQKISTPKIDRMLDGALDAGALGGKINGSGGGGCMFAYAPDNADRVAAAVERAGGRAYIVTVDSGTRTDYSNQRG